MSNKKSTRKNLRIFLTLLCVYIVFWGAIAYPIKMAIPEEGLAPWIWILILSLSVIVFIVLYLVVIYLMKKREEK